MKLSRLTSLPLRTKLTAAIAIPIVGLVGLGAVQVQSLTTDVSTTESQLGVVEGNVTFAEVAAAIRTERDVQLSVVSLASPLNRSEDGRNSYYERVRSETDAVISSALGSSSMSAADRQSLESIRARLAEARVAIGNDPHQMRDELIVELQAGGTTDPGSISAAQDTFDAIVTDTIRLIDVEASSDLDAQTIQDLTTLQLSSAFDEAIRLEALGYLELSLLAPEEQPEAVVVAARARGAQSVQLETTVREVGSSALANSFETLIEGPRYQAFVDLRNDIASQDVGEIAVPRNTVFFVLLALTNNLDDIKSEIVETASTAASDSSDAAQRQLLVGGAALAGLLGLVAVLTLTLFRSIRQPLLTLTQRSRAISDVELPHVVKLLREEGLTADVPEIVPIESQTDDEVGELVEAFNDMHRTAVDLASEQAASRRTVADMFVNLGRRNQRLLMRILDYLDGLEANEKDPETLERLFKIDHLATRMRRNAESLIVLAGAREARVFDAPVAVAEVVRSALGEVEGYERVDLDVRTDKLIDGSAVADAAHLLAELIENSLTFSPPTSRVIVSAADSAKGFAIAVADAGIGMTPDAMVEANETIARAMTLEETPSNELGHHVVGRLAGRHGIQVDLRDGITDGLVAKVIVPSSLISDPVDDEEDLASLFSTESPDHVIEVAPAEEFATSERMIETRDVVTAEALELSVVPDLDPVDDHVVDGPQLAPINAEPSAIADTDIAAADVEVAAEWSDPAPEPATAPAKPMSVAEASRRARTERAAEAEAEAEAAASSTADKVPSVLETTSGFALARRQPAENESEPESTPAPTSDDSPPLARRHSDARPDGSSNPLGVTRSPGTNLPFGVKPTMDMPSVDGDPHDPSPVLVPAGTASDEVVDTENADAGSRFAASMSSFQSGIQRATSSNDDTEESS